MFRDSKVTQNEYYLNRFSLLLSYFLGSQK